MSDTSAGSVADLTAFRERWAARTPPGAAAEDAWVLPEQVLPAPPTGTVTFLLTDIEGSTRRWEAQGDAMAAAVARHYEILDAAIAAHGGVRPVEQGEGDSLVAVFGRASDAARAALAAQRALHSERWPAGAEIAVRMALHTGEAQLRDGLYYVGPTIIRCARIRALGSGGQILTSAVTADLMAEGLPEDVELLPLGVHRLKELRQPERVFQLTHEVLPRQFPPLRSVDALPSNLPAELTRFIGRHEALSEVADLVSPRQVVTLTGPGGSGKTRLAAQIGRGLAPDYPDGVCWIELAGVADPTQVPNALMAGLGILDSRSLDTVKRITTYLADRRILLVLDNCEHLLAAAAEMVASLLEACPQVSLLATSREPLGVPGEQVWPVPPMSLPDEQATSDGLLESEAVRLFVDRAMTARPGFKIDRTSSATIAAICRRLDGIPLAIELAAARLRVLTPDRVLAGLNDRFRMLVGGASTAPPRQQTLEASVEWSHDLLTPSEQILFRRLGVFCGGFTMEAAEAVTGEAPLDAANVVTLLSGLVERSLVIFDGERYRLLETIREFAANRLEAAGEAPAVSDRHAVFFLDLAESVNAALEVAPQPELLGAIEAEHDNLRAALDRAITAGHHERALRLLNALTLPWGIRGHYTEALRWHRRVLAAVPDGNTPLRLRALGDLSHLSFYGMELAGAFGTAEAEQAAAEARETGNRGVLVRARLDQLALQGWIDPEAALPALEALVDEARVVDEPWALRCALWWLAFHWVVYRDRPDRAAPAAAELDRLVAATPNPYWRASLALGPMVTALRQGRYDEARSFFDGALADALTLIDPMLECYVVALGCDVPLAVGHFDEAAALLARSIERQDRIGSSLRMEWNEVRLAGIDVARGDFAAARRQLEKSAAAARDGGVPLLVIYYDLSLSRIALEECDLAAARAWMDEALQTAAVLGTPWLLVMVRNAAGRLARAEGNNGDAEDHLQRALALCVEYGFRGVAADVLENLGGLARALDSHAEGIRLLGAAAALRDDSGARRWPIDEPNFAADAAALKAAIGDDRWDVFDKEGRSLTLSDAAAYAARARGERKRPSKGWEALTPTELEVARLAAHGLTNAEIGRRLFITAGTAKIHLSHIYAKLGIANRAQLAAQATAHELGAG